MNLHRLLLGLFLTTSYLTLSARPMMSSPAPEGYDIQVEVINENIGTLVGALGVTDLTGYSCTRLYVEMNNASDFMSSVSGDATNPTYVNTTTDFYHAVLGAGTPNGINSLLFAVYPDLEYDSWVTIGLESVPDVMAGEANVSTVQSMVNPWLTNFDPGGGLPGGNVAIDDLIGGAWYALNGDANGVAGDDLRVLIGQFTTTGELSGQIYCQVFINGDGMDEFRDTFYFGPSADVEGCMDLTACNYNPDATLDDGSCELPLDGLDCDGNCLADADGDGICDGNEIAGCQDDTACNYNADATDDDGSCEFTSCAGCLDDAACNYDEDALIDDGSCTYADAGLDCDGNCLADADGDGICDGDEIAGCQDNTACNYNADATDDDGSCTYADAGLDCDGNCLADADGDGICDGDEIAGCQDGTACNYNADATDDDGSCTYADAGYDCDGSCLSDEDGDGICDAFDPCDDPDLTPVVLPVVPATFISEVTLNGDPVVGMTVLALVDGETVGVDEAFEYEGGSWISMSLYTMGGDVVEFELFDAAECELYDIDLTLTVSTEGEELGTFDAPGDLPFLSDDAIMGCTDATACNYDEDANINDGSCEYPEAGLDCDGNCLADADGDGICDGDEIEGCQDTMACNYSEDATDDDGSCEYTSCAGCQDEAACNYDSEATLDDGSCVFADEGYDCDGNCLADADGDSICDPFDPCNEPNFDVTVLPVIPNTIIANVTLDGMPIYGGIVIATADDVVIGAGMTFEFEGASYVNMNLYLEAGQTVSLDLFDADECALYELDFDLLATEEGGELGTFDDPADLPYLSGDAIEGCMDETACNYNENATIPATCVYPEQYCGADYYNCDCECLNDADGDGICDEAEVVGCGDELACNYDADATDIDNALCTYPAEDYLDCDGNCLSDVDGDGLCDEEEIPGCTDEEACNYNADATDEDNSCEYAEIGFDCDGNPLELDPCDPDCIVFDPPVEDYTVECLSDLVDMTCESPTSALNTCTGATYEDIACVSTPSDQPYMAGEATTAFGSGPDAALRIYGLSMAGFAESDYFVETGDGLSFSQYANGVAILEGSVVNENNPNQGFDLFYVFDQGVSGAEWAAMGKGFKYIYTCEDLPFDEWDIYMLKSDQSFLTGTGDFEGSLLTVNHAPSNGYFGFQVGEGANDHNCDFGMGGWFAWEGQINGQPVNGALGDVIVDVTLSPVTPDVNDPCVTNIYTVIDDSCGAINVTQQVCRLDQTPPTFDFCPSDTVIACGDDLPEVPTLTATDNCDDEGSPIVTYLGEEVIELTSSACYTLQRTWEATDLFDNTATCTQLVHVEDNVAPDIDLMIPGDLQVSVTAMCTADLSTDMTGLASADYTDNCAFDSGDITYLDIVTDSTAAGCYTVERLWTATAVDSCGNVAEATGTQTIDVIDEQAPVITLSDTQPEIACDAWNCDLDELVGLGLVSWEDNCGIDTAYIVCEPMSGGCVSPVPTWDVAYTVVDQCGNSTTMHQFILLIDTVAPTIDITCPADVVVELDANCEGELDPAQSGEVSITSTDNCDAAPELSYTIEDSAPEYTCAGTYVITRTFFAVSTDHCGNTATATCTQLLTVVDVTAPVITSITCPADTTLALGEDCTADFSQIGAPNVVAEDGCDANPTVMTYFEDGPSTPTCDGSDGSADGSLSFERTFFAYAVDACGNVSDTVSCVQTITAVDDTAPSFGDFPAYESVSCEMLSDPLDPTQLPLEAFDNCDDSLTIAIEAWPLSGSCPGSWMRIWTATDDCGNSVMAEQYIALYDDEAPVITCPSDTVLSAGVDMAADTTTATLGMATATDNCSQWSDIDITWVDDDFTVDCTGDDDLSEGTMTFTRTFTAEDFCENTDSCEQLITLVDDLGPVAEVENVSIACADYDPTQTYGDFTATDNFDTDVSWSWAEDSVYAQECTGTYLADRTWTFVDDCGNATEVQQTLSIFDDVAPEVLAGDMFLELSCEEYSDEVSPENILIVVEDACGSEVSITFFDTPFSGSCVQPVGMFMRTYTFEDDCGNANMFTQFIELYDNTPPVIDMTCPADTVLAADADCAADLSVDALGLAEVIATDNCGGAAPDVELTWMDHDTTETCAGSFSFTRTFTAVAIDNCGNTATATCQQLVGVEDVTAPEFVEALPEDATVSCDALPEAAVLTATDACDSAPMVDFSEVTNDDDDCASNYMLVRTWTATDACGNSTSHEQTLTVVDNTAPEWASELPADTTVSCDAIPEAAVLDVFDSCDGSLEATFNEGAVDGDCAQAQTLTRTWSAMDCAGNAISHVQVITVIDTTAPVISGPLTLEVPCTDWGMDTVYAEVTDNCDPDVELVLLNEIEVSGSCAGSYLLTYAAMDACGNADTLVQSIDLVDTEAPVFTFIPQDTTLSCDNDYTVGSLGAAQAADGCDSDVEIGYSDSIVLINDCAGTAEVVRTWTAEDECGNNKTVDQLITLIDETAPEFVEALPADTTVTCDMVPVGVILTATDNCDPDVVVNYAEVMDDDDLCPHNYTLTRTWSAMDCAGNPLSHTQVVTVIDSVAPVFTGGPMDTTVACDAVPAPAELLMLQAEDQCDDALSYAYEGEVLTEGDCTNGYSLTRTWSATDCAGNQSEWMQTLTVIDTVAPVITLTFDDGSMAHDTTVSCLDEAPLVDAIAADACDGAPTVEMAIDTLGLDDCGNATIAYLVSSSDDCGNQSEASITITVSDETTPEWLNTCGLDDGEVVDVCAEDFTGGTLLPSTEACEVTATDNCGGDVSIELETESIGEFAPNDSVLQYCTSVTPEAYSDDETCNGYETHAARLFNFAGGEFYSTQGAGVVSQLANGDWVIEETLVDNSNPNAGWTVSFTLTDGMDFDTWSNQDFPTSFKQDCENLTDYHEDWTYWFLSEGTLTGWGEYEGSFLTCTHQPANQFYRFQVGLGANNMNENYSYSGWFFYSGTHLNTPVMGSGDFFGDLDCALPYQIAYDYTATDCSGNAAEFGYTINVTGEVCDGEGGAGLAGTDTGSTPQHLGVQAAASGEARGPLQVSHIAPNPTQDHARIGFNALKAMRLEVQLFDASGMFVKNLFNGHVEKDQMYTLDIQASALQSGVYQVRMMSSEVTIVKQFLVTK